MTEITSRSSFSFIRYAQCWEDADILMEALSIKPGARCVSIASAGDNTMAMLAFSPSRVTALDMNPAQIACVEIRRAAYAGLEHHDFLVLMGSRTGRDRNSIYKTIRHLMTEEARLFWDERPDLISAGIGTAGKFERFFRIFRTRIMPFVHSNKVINSLLIGGPKGKRKAFLGKTGIPGDGA